jgi:phage shock protein PspC (stress-responsive transcriptional regulator)
MRKLFRTRHNKKIGGVCGGIGNYLHIDPTIIRIFFIFICVFTAILPLVIGYIISCIIIPIEPINTKEMFRKLYRSNNNRKIAGIIGGVSHLIKIDATILRLILVFICLITGILPVVLLYIVGWIIIPEAPTSDTIEIT